MADKKKIGAFIVLDGEKEFKAAVTECNKKLTSMRSELGLVKEKYAENANSLEALNAKSDVFSKTLQLQKEKLDATAVGYKNAVTSQKNIEDGLSKLKAGYQAAQEKMEQMKRSTDVTDKELDEQKRLMDELSSAIKKGESNYQRATDRVNTWKNKLNTAETQVIKANRAVKENSRYMDEAKKSTNNCATSIDQYGKKVREITVNVNEIGSRSDAAFGALANQIVASGVADKAKEVAESLYECSEAAGEFETASAKVSTIADNSKTSMEDLNKEMLKVSSDTGEAVSGIAESTYQAISASVDTSKAVDTVETATKAAVGGFTDSETAIDGLTTVLNSYGDKVKDATQVSDIFIRVQKLGKTDFGEIASSIGKVAANAATYNVSIQNLGAAYVELTKRGVKTAEATTYIKSLLKDLSKNGSTTSKILKNKTGKTFAQLCGEGKNLAEIIEILSDSVGGNTTAFSNLFSTQEAGTAAVMLMNAGTEDYNKTLNDVTDSAGTTEEAFEKMSATSDHAKQKMLNGINNLKIAIGTELNKSLAGLYEKGGDVIQWATDFVNKHPEVVKAIAAISAGVVGLTAAFSAYTVATRVLIPLTQSFYAALATNPFGIVAVALITLVPLLVTLRTATSDANSEIDKEVVANRNARKAIEEKNKAIRDGIKETKDELNNTKDSVSSTDNLIARLIELNFNQDKTLGQKKEIKAIVDNLKDKIPQLAKAYDQETGAVILTKKQILQLAEAYKKEAIAKGMQKQLTEATEKAAEAETNYANAKENSKKATSDLKAAEAEEKKLKEQLNECERKRSKSSFFDREAQRNSDKALEAYRQQHKKVEQLAKEQEKAEKAAKSAAKTQEEANKTVKEAVDYYDKYQKELLKAGKAQGKTSDDAKKTAKSYKDLEVAFKKGSAGAKRYGQYVSKDLEEGFQTAVKIAKKTGTKIPDGLIKGLKDGSKSPATAVNELNKATSKKLLELSKEAKKIGAYIPEDLTTGLKNGTLDVTAAYEGINKEISRLADKQEDDMKKAGLKISQKIKNGYQSGGTAAIEAIQSSRKKLKNLMDDAGVDSMDGLLHGIAKRKGSVVAAFEKIADEVTDGYKKKLGIHSPSRVFAKLGGYTVQGIIKGTDEQKKNLQKKYTEMGSVVDIAFRKALDIHSPSKKMASNGKYIVQGIIYGMNGETKNAEKTATKVAKKIVKSSQKASKKAVKKTENIVSTKNLNEKQIMDAWKKAIKATKKGTDEHIKALKKYKKAKEKLLKDEKKLQKDFKKTYESYMKDLQSKIKDYKSQINDLKQTYADSVSSVQSSIAGAWGMFGKAQITRTNNADGLVRNMKTQADTVEQYQKNMDKLRKRGLSKELMKELEAAGISAAGDVSTLVSMTDKQLKQYQSYYNQRQKYAKKEALKENADLKASTDAQVKTLEKKMDKLEQSYKKKIDKLEAKYKKQMKKLGINVTNSFAKGIEKGYESVYKAITKMTGTSLQQVKKNLGLLSSSKKSKKKKLSTKSATGTIAEQGVNPKEYTVTEKVVNPTALGHVSKLQKEAQSIANMIDTAFPKKGISSGKAGVNTGIVNNPVNSPVQLNIMMDSKTVAAATFNQLDLMQGANIRLLQRGLSR